MYRPNQTAFVDLVIENNFDFDLNIPFLFVNILSGSNSSQSDLNILTINDQSYASYPIDYLMAFNQAGIGGFIAPKSSFTLRLKLRPKDERFEGSCPIQISLLNMNLFKEFLLTQLDSFQNFTGIYEKLAFEYLKFKFLEKVEKNPHEFIYETLNEFSLFNEQSYRFDSLILYNLYRLDGAYLNLDLIKSNDIELFGGFNLFRTYSSKISMRKSKSRFGFGWTDNLEVRIEKDQLFDILWVYKNGKSYRLESGDQENVYIMNLVRAEIRQNEVRVEFLNENLLVDYDMQTKCIKTFKLLNSNESVRVECSKERINQIETSSSRITFSYSENLLKYIDKVDKNTGERETIIYLYDSKNRLVCVQKDSTTIEYEYNDFESLSFVSLNDKLITYDYNSDNLIKNIRIENKDSKTVIFDREFVFHDNGPIEIIDFKNKNKSIQFMIGLGGNVYTIKGSNKELKYKSDFKTLKSSTYLNDELTNVLNIDLDSSSVIKKYPSDDMEYKSNILFKNSTNKASEIFDFNLNKIIVNEKFVDSIQIIEVILEDGSKETKLINKNAKSIHIERRDRKNEIVILFNSEFKAKKQTYSYFSTINGDLRVCNFVYDHKGKLTEAWNTLDTFENVSLTYDSNEMLIETFYNEKHSHFYDYDSEFDLIGVRNEDIEFVYKYDQFDQLKKLSSLNYKNKGNQNEIEILKVNHLSDGYEITYLNEKRSFIYHYDTDSKLLTNYTIVDLADLQNSLSYLYSYDETPSKKLVKVVKANETYEIKYYYNSVNRLIAYVNEESGLSMEIEYDSNGNRKKLVKSIQNTRSGDVSLSTTFYDVNKLNQFESINDLKLTYDLNGDLTKISNQSLTEEYSYYPDGKLYRYVDNNEDCVYNYDCLERLNQIKCQNSGIYEIGYHSSNKFDELFFIKLPNKSFIYFTQIPSIGINGFVFEGEFFLMEKNENFQVVELININKIEKKHNGKEFLKYLDPLESIQTDFPFDVNSFKFKVNKNVLLSENSKPSFVNNKERDLGVKYDAPLTLNSYETNSITINSLEFYASDGFKSDLNKRVFELNALKLPEMTSELLLTDILTDIKDASVKYKIRKSTISNSIIRSFNDSRMNSFERNKGLVSDVCSALAQAGYEYFVNGKNASTVGKEVLTSLLITPEFAAVSNAIQTGDYYGSLSSYMADKLSSGVIDEMASHLLSTPFLKNPAVQCSLGVAKYFLPQFLQPLINSTLNISTPKDPNEMTGPFGYGPENFIIYNQEYITFSIYFENIENATGPAQVVLLDSYLTELFDLRSIEFISYGFNDFNKELTGLELSYINQIAEWENDRISVRFQAFVDPVSRRLKCIYKTIDKVTGEVPQDASFGFLPPKNGSYGQGFFKFKIKLSKIIQHFDFIQINSTIIFDNEEPIVTNDLFYTIDKESPKLQFEWNEVEEYLFFNSSDSGSGVKQFTIYDQANILLNSNEKLYKLALEANKEFEIFYSIEDNVGNNLDRILIGKISTLKSKLCQNNCSSNGVCNTSNGICECFQNYVGNDCRKPIAETDQTLTQLLNNLNVQLEFQKTLTRNVYDFELNILTESISSLKLINLPEEIMLVNNIKLEWDLMDESENNTVEFQLRVPFNYSNLFVLQLLISFKNHNETTNLNYEVYLESYLNQPEINLIISCYDHEKEKNFIDIVFTNLIEQDTVEVYLIKTDPFLNMYIIEYSNVSKTITIEVKSTEILFETNIYLELSFNKNYKEAYIWSQVFNFESCPLKEIATTDSFSILDTSLTDHFMSSQSESSLTDNHLSTTSIELFETSLLNSIEPSSATASSLTIYDTSLNNDLSSQSSSFSDPLSSTLQNNQLSSTFFNSISFDKFTSSETSLVNEITSPVSFMITESEKTDETKHTTLHQSKTTKELMEKERHNFTIYFIIGGSVLLLAGLVSISIYCYKKKKSRMQIEPNENIQMNQY